MSKFLLSFLLLFAVLAGQTMAFHDPVLLRSPLFHIVMHIFGGAGVAFLCLGLANSAKLSGPRVKYALILGVLIFGLLWELFETLTNLTGHRIGSTAYYLDLTKDLINDLIGGVLVIWFFK